MGARQADTWATPVFYKVTLENIWNWRFPGQKAKGTQHTLQVTL